jgi:hypothetical protein
VLMQTLKHGFDYKVTTTPVIGLGLAEVVAIIWNLQGY